MGKEIERKFLLSFLPEGMSGVSMRQGYLQSEKERAVRVRTVEKDGSKKGVLTIKGMGSESGMSRYEFETEIPVSDADHLLLLCDKPLIEKTRYKYDYEGLTWEIDEFYGVNDGLVVAEVELECEDQQFEKPDFIGEEVTGQVKYYNIPKMKFYVIPRELYQPIKQNVVILHNGENTANSKNFYNFLQTDYVRNIIKINGYDIYC